MMGSLFPFRVFFTLSGIKSMHCTWTRKKTLWYWPWSFHFLPQYLYYLELMLYIRAVLAVGDKPLIMCQFQLILTLYMFALEFLKLLTDQQQLEFVENQMVGAKLAI